MRVFGIAVVIIIGSFHSVLAQRWSPFKNLRYDEQYSQLSEDTTHHNFYAKFKHAGRNSTTVSFGGEFRSQYFSIKNEDWGETEESTDNYLLSRYLLHANLNLKNRFRAFVQVQGGRADWKKSVGAIDQNETDLHQAFLDYRWSLSDSAFVTIRTGRQELLYGSQRLVSVREGPNYRQSFDAIKAMFRFRASSIDFFYGHHVAINTGFFNDVISDNIKFSGIYASMKPFSVLNSDVYIFGYHKRNASYHNMQGTEQRYSIGWRLWNISPAFSYDAEFVAQLGSIGQYAIRAATAGISVSYVFRDFVLSPEFGLKTEAFTGDRNAIDHVSNTFNAMFPRGGYFGLAALFGPANMMDVHPSVTFSLTSMLALTCEYDAFWRYSTADGLYTFNGNTLYTGDAGRAKFIGDQVSGELAFNPNIFIKCTMEVKWFNSGPYLKEAGTGKDILFGLLQLQIKF